MTTIQRLGHTVTKLISSFLSSNSLTDTHAIGREVIPNIALGKLMYRYTTLNLLLGADSHAVTYHYAVRSRMHIYSLINVNREETVFSIA